SFHLSAPERMRGGPLPSPIRQGKGLVTYCGFSKFSMMLIAAGPTSTTKMLGKMNGINGIQSSERRSRESAPQCRAHPTTWGNLNGKIPKSGPHLPEDSEQSF